MSTSLSNKTVMDAWDICANTCSLPDKAGHLVPSLNTHSITFHKFTQQQQKKNKKKLPHHSKMCVSVAIATEKTGHTVSAAKQETPRILTEGWKFYPTGFHCKK